MVRLCLALATFKGSAQTTVASASTTAVVVDAGPNHRVWQYQTYEPMPNGKTVARLHQYRELAAGLNYLDAKGKWTPSVEKIEVFSGGAKAQQGQHKVVFSSNLNTAGAIDVHAADGQRLRSHIIGLIYADSTTRQAVLIAGMQDSDGEVVGDNQVLYPNAFDGVKADVRYTYRRDGLEQDVILREQLPAPEAYGMNSATTELEVVTEFINPPPAWVSDMQAEPDTESDQWISWGATSLGRGKAFSLNGEDAPASVTKRYTVINGRYFLQEKVRLPDIAPALSKLPEQASNARRRQGMASTHFTFPAAPATKSAARPMRLAMGAEASKGYVLDYVSTSTAYTNYLFQGDTTYYISGTLGLMGTSTFEGGAVIKYAPNASIFITQPCGINFQCGPYRPVIFTAIDDNTVGAIISGSTGTPVGYYANAALTFISPQSLTPVANFRISYAKQAISCIGNSLYYYNGQIINCLNGFTSYGANPQYLRNILFENVQTNFNQLLQGQFDVQNSTFCGSSYLMTIRNQPNQISTLNLVNCILANVANCQTNGPSPGTYGLSGSYNGFFNSYTFGNNQFTNAIYPLQQVGAAGCYLTSPNGFIGVGTSNLDSTWSAMLPQKTSFAPSVFSNLSITIATNFSMQAQRGSTNHPNLGYHYDPLDYVFSGVNLSSNITFSAGTAVGWFELPGSGGPGYGLGLLDGTSAVFSGTVTQPCAFVRYSVVQEGGTGLWQDLGWWGGIVNIDNYNPGNPAALITQFTRFSAAANDSNLFRDGQNGQPLMVQGTDDEFLNGAGGYNLEMSFTNCLFFRSSIGNGTSESYPYEIYRNCTFHGGLLEFGHSEDGAPYWYSCLRDCSFDGTSFAIDDPFGSNTTYENYNYNAFLSGAAQPPNEGANTITVTNFNWQNSWFGNFYLPPNSSLIQQGSTTADQVGLYHFTTQTNQVQETNSIVDIGYHYVTTDAYGNPLDSNGDGIPDYLEYPNGMPPMILTQPVSQTAIVADDVFFSVVAVGFPAPGYQWYFNGVAIGGATNATLELDDIQTNNVGNYSVTVANAYGVLNSQTAALASVTWPGSYTVVQGSLTNYDFQSDTTYYVNTNVLLYGSTILEGGTVIKFGNHPFAELVLNGPLTCLTAPYRPVLLTSKDENAMGATIDRSTGSPATNGLATYLLDDFGQTNAYRNLHLRYASVGISGINPLNVWDSQFLHCGTAVAGTGSIGLHNVLIFQATNCVATVGGVTGEFVTADQATSFCPGTYAGASLTNSLLTSIGNTTGVSLASSVLMT
jgi:hypothetical protein